MLLFLVFFFCCCPARYGIRENTLCLGTYYAPQKETGYLSLCLPFIEAAKVEPAIYTFQLSQPRPPIVVDRSRLGYRTAGHTLLESFSMKRFLLEPFLRALDSQFPLGGQPARQTSNEFVPLTANPPAQE